MEHVSRPVVAGILTALVGFTSSFAVVLAGLRGVGASPAEAASGLLAVCATQALGVLWLVRRHRIPLTLAWSTPGAALLASTGVVHGGWPAAVGAFLVTGALLVITGRWAPPRPPHRRDPDADRAGHAGRGGTRAVPGPGA